MKNTLKYFLYLLMFMPMVQATPLNELVKSVCHKTIPNLWKKYVIDAIALGNITTDDPYLSPKEHFYYRLQSSIASYQQKVKEHFSLDNILDQQIHEDVLTQEEISTYSRFLTFDTFAFKGYPALERGLDNKFRFFCTALPAIILDLDQPRLYDLKNPEMDPIYQGTLERELENFFRVFMSQISHPALLSPLITEYLQFCAHFIGNTLTVARSWSKPFCCYLDKSYIYRPSFSEPPSQTERCLLAARLLAEEIDHWFHNHPQQDPKIADLLNELKQKMFAQVEAFEHNQTAWWTVSYWSATPTKDNNFALLKEYYQELLVAYLHKLLAAESHNNL